jgi:hypothetical protein
MGHLDVAARGGRKSRTAPAAIIDEVLARFAPMFG